MNIVVVIVVVKVFDVKLDSIGGGVVFIVVVAFILGEILHFYAPMGAPLFIPINNVTEVTFHEHTQNASFRYREEKSNTKAFL